MEWTESDIQALKAQEAKDLAVEFLQLLEAKERGLISPGEVQMKELEFKLQLRKAEIEDQRQRESHEKAIRELDLQIEQERTRAAEAESHANQIRDSLARVIDRVTEANETLSTQFERAAREYNLKTERLEAEYAAKQADLAQRLQELEQQRDALRAEISTLSDLQGDALEVGKLREEIDRRKKESRLEQSEVDEQVAAAEFEKTKRIREVQRKRELELAQLDAEHQQAVLQRNRQTTEKILTSLGLVAIEQQELDGLRGKLQAQQTRGEHELQQLRDEAREAFRREFNITRTESVDVTDLYYREQAARTEVEQLRSHLDKQDTEIRRMRQHIEQEPQRIATAIEAAKTQVQNFIEQGPKR